MSAARCSSCHCFSRNCPVGRPNHKTVATVGSSCSMNSLGRHYRDPLDPANPSCDYELQGVKCSFFASGHEYVGIPYPGDITTGPVSDPIPAPSSDLSAILTLLNQQKTDADLQREQVRLLQVQVTNLLQRDVTPTVSSQFNSVPATTASLSMSTTTSSMAAMPSLPTFTTNAAPHVVTSAAAQLSAAFQSGMGQQNQFTGLTIDHLRSDPVMMSQAAAVLAQATQNVPPLNPNPLDGLAASLRNLQQNQVVINSVDQLYKATTVNKQLRCFEFASTGQFSYRNQLKQDNINPVTFAFGAFKYLEACKSGLINVSDKEFLARLRHLKNVFEIACLSSNLNSFTEHSWLIAREYDTRVIADIESGTKSWEGLSNGIEPDSIYCAKETVEIKTKPKKVKETRVKNEETVKVKKLCTTYNTHRSSESCYWEHVNKGQTCVFDHYCSWCKQNRSVDEKHKALSCEHKPE